MPNHRRAHAEVPRAAAARNLTANGLPRASRASQFMPFAALTGYYELTRQQERIREPKHDLTDEEALALSRAMERIGRGSWVRVTHYDRDAYRVTSGLVGAVDPARRLLQVVGELIRFDDIWRIECAGACGHAT